MQRFHPLIKEKKGTLLAPTTLAQAPKVPASGGSRDIAPLGNIADLNSLKCLFLLLDFSLLLSQISFSCCLLLLIHLFRIKWRFLLLFFFTFYCFARTQETTPPTTVLKTMLLTIPRAIEATKNT